MAKRKDSTRKVNPGDQERRKDKQKLLAKNRQERLSQRLLQKVKGDPDTYKDEYDKYERYALNKKLDAAGKKRWSELQKMKVHIDVAIAHKRQGDIIASDADGRKELGSLAKLAAQARDHRRRGADIFDGNSIIKSTLPLKASYSDDEESDDCNYEYYSEEDKCDSYEEYSDPLPPDEPPPDIKMLIPPTQMLDTSNGSIGFSHRTIVAGGSQHQHPYGQYPNIVTSSEPRYTPSISVPAKLHKEKLEGSETTTSSAPAFLPVSVLMKQQQNQIGQSKETRAFKPINDDNILAKPINGNNLVGLDTTIVGDALEKCNPILPPLSRLKRKKKEPKQEQEETGLASSVLIGPVRPTDINRLHEDDGNLNTRNTTSDVKSATATFPLQTLPGSIKKLRIEGSSHSTTDATALVSTELISNEGLDELFKSVLNE